MKNQKLKTKFLTGTVATATMASFILPSALSSVSANEVTQPQAVTDLNVQPIVLTQEQEKIVNDSIELANKLTSENILTYGANGTVFFDYDRAIAIGLDKELANEFQKLARSSQLRGKVSVVLKLGPQAKQMGAIAGVALASSYAAGAFSALLAVSPIAYGALIAVFAGCVGAAWGVPTITVSVDVPLVSWTKTIQLP